MPHRTYMSDFKEPSIYGKPRFGLILGVFCVSIVVLLIAGFFFLRSGVLRLHDTNAHRTGMVFVLPSITTR